MPVLRCCDAEDKCVDLCPCPTCDLENCGTHDKCPKPNDAPCDKEGF